MHDGKVMNMTDGQNNKRTSHNIIMENRKSLTISGVSDLDSFDEHTVVMFTELGELTVRGHDLHINEMSVGTGELVVMGEITALIYGDKERKSASGFIAKLFR